MDPSLSGASTWEQRVHDIAYKNGITIKSWTDFRPQSPILRQELFIIATRLDVWNNTTGGCATHTLIKTPNTVPVETSPEPQIPLPDATL